MSLKPIVTNDPRFRAGCKLVKSGKADCGAVNLFAALVEETRCQFGESSLNSAASYYEYGHALFRAACRIKEGGISDNDDDNLKNGLDRKPHAGEEGSVNSGSSSCGPTEDGTGKRKSAKLSRLACVSDERDAIVSKQERATQDGENDESDDVKLALELMENSWAILDDYVQSHENENYVPVKIDSENMTEDSSSSHSTSKNKVNENVDKASKTYLNWAKDQQPRILLGIGDVFEYQEKYGDAADAYIRAIPLRERYIPDEKPTPSIDLLTRRRQFVEVLVLVAETLLKCQEGEDVVTSESKLLIVKDSERIDFARGYYDKAKEELQETVYLMGKLASQKNDITSEKEDICFIATMLMGVGTTLAELDENHAVESEGGFTNKKRKLP